MRRDFGGLREEVGRTADVNGTSGSHSCFVWDKKRRDSI